MLKRCLILVLLSALVACSNDDSCDSDIDLSDISLDFEFENLTHTLNEIESTEALNIFFEKHPVIRDEFFEYGGRPTEEQVLTDLSKLVQNPEIKAVFQTNSYSAFEEVLDKNRDLREFLSYDYLSVNKGKNLKHLYEMISGSRIMSLTGRESTSVEPLRNYLNANPKEKDYYYTIFAYRSDDQLLKDNYELLQNPFVDTLYQETMSLIDAGMVSYELDRAYKRVKKAYPNFTPPKVQTVYSGFGKDIYLTDSLLIIGLDYYLGENASFRPSVYDYLRVRLTPDHLVPQLIQFTSLKFNATKKGKRTILEDMIYYGKAMEFTSEMLPCVADSIIMGYSSKQIADAMVSEGVIWSHFLERKLLYSDIPSDITKYIDERPNIPEIDKNCPGRIGQWLGWQIVKAYREESGVDIKELMEETDAQKILTRSKYRPRSR
ncbi:hypothetical protein [Roseivirga sp. E12]|uniref:gliding motility protein GldB-related protein n=1 Tax=Roseivirga sp. E12 TaxID=2819237 RepID=UPI001ABC2E22|nr:hypothetical protein [Roseivirga sp. E12]MBO3699826.1 hypothetical protein [Roseivirga sp. E12]